MDSVFSMYGRQYDRDSGEFTDWFAPVSLHRTKEGAQKAGEEYAINHILKRHMEYCEYGFDEFITKKNYKILKTMAHEVELIRTEGDKFVWPEYEPNERPWGNPKFSQNFLKFFEACHHEYRRKVLSLIGFEFYEVNIMKIND